MPWSSFRLQLKKTFPGANNLLLAGQRNIHQLKNNHAQQAAVALMKRGDSNSYTGSMQYSVKFSFHVLLIFVLPARWPDKVLGRGFQCSYIFVAPDGKVWHAEEFRTNF